MGRAYGRGYGAGYLDDVEEVIVTERVDDPLDGRLGDLHAKTLHAAARVDQDHHVLRRRRRLDVPARTPSVAPAITCIRHVR